MARSYRRVPLSARPVFSQAAIETIMLALEHPRPPRVSLGTFLRTLQFKIIRHENATLDSQAIVPSLPAMRQLYRAMQEEGGARVREMLTGKETYGC